LSPFENRQSADLIFNFVSSGGKLGQWKCFQKFCFERQELAIIIIILSFFLF
jgi:hypothetical protein